jgi:hypothetical protein
MRGRRASLAAVAGAALLAGLAGASSVAQEEGAALADDAYHFSSWADGRHDGSYTEWWYFNVFDAAHGVQAIFSYFVTNPADLLGGEKVQMVAVAYTAQGVVSEVDDYPPESFSAGAQQPDVTIGENRVRVIGADSYRVSGSTRDGRMAWDLTYTRAAQPWFAADRMTVGSFPWETMSWLVSMPRAQVTGTLLVDGRPYEINAPGYHDHNWGEWVPTDGLWNWAQFSDGRLALEVGDFIGKPVGTVGIDLDGTRSVFSKDAYTFVHTRWWIDWQNGVWYPTESMLSAQNNNRKLQVTIRAIKTEPLRGDLPFPLRDLIIYEQTARYDGTLWEKNASGEWVVASLIRGNGFKEFTARRY